MGLLEDTLNRIVPLSSETEEEIRTRWNRLYLGLTYMGNAVDMMVEMTEKGYRISAEKMLEKMNGYHIDEYMLHWQSHTNVDAFIHLLTHESDVEKAKKHMKKVMECLVRGWFCIVVPDETA